MIPYFSVKTTFAPVKNKMIKFTDSLLVQITFKDKYLIIILLFML